MEVNVEDSEAIQIFWTIFNEVLWVGAQTRQGQNGQVFSVSLAMCATELYRVFFTIDSL